tara:strand:+ start:6671 stop:7012 length:342 start_codon:yes stop_codon:yes gene_type:complete
MIKKSILQYIQVDTNIQNLNEQLKQQRKNKEILSQDIIDFCKNNSKTKINLPDGSFLVLNKTNTYQSLSYNFIEEKIKEFNSKFATNIPTKELMFFIKQERNNKQSFELKHKS